VYSSTSAAPAASTSPPRIFSASGCGSASHRVRSNGTSPATIAGPPKQTNPTLPVIVRSRERVTTQRAYDAEIPLVVHLAPMDLHPDQEQTLAEMRPAESDPRVISQKPQSGGVLRGGGKVNVVVSRRKDRS